MVYKKEIPLSEVSPAWRNWIAVVGTRYLWRTGKVMTENDYEESDIMFRKFVGKEAYYVEEETILNRIQKDLDDANDMMEAANSMLDLFKK